MIAKIERMVTDQYVFVGLSGHVQSINQSILFAQNVQRYTYRAFQLRAGQQG